MAAYDLETIIQLWGAEKLTAEQAIGHMLQHLQKLREELKEVRKRLRELERSQED